MAKVNIIIVEDDAITAMDIENQLKQLGYGVTAKVSDGKEAIQKAKENTPDMVLMDIVLKGEMDGIEAAEEIHTQFDIPVVFLTAFADKERLKRAKLTNPFGFILKPFQDKDLKVTIEMALYVTKVDAERKQTEDVLRESEANLAKAQQIAHIGNWSWNIKENRVSWSDELYRIVGLSPQEFEANYEAYLKCIHPDDLHYFRGFTEKALKEKKPFSLEYRIVRPNNEIRIVHEKGEVTVDTNGNPINFFGTAQDITNIKQKEEVLRQAHEELEQRVEERTAEFAKAIEKMKKEMDERKRTEKNLQLHREIIENMAEGVYLIRTSDGAIVYTNLQFERMFGYGSEELKGKHVSIVNAPTEKTPEETAEEIIQSLNEKGAWSGEIENVKKDGTLFWCHANISTFNHYKFGEVWISVCEDITGKKQIEEYI